MHSWKIVFGAAWVVLQAALIFTAGRRAEGSFGFRMFPEISQVTVHLARLVGEAPKPVPVEDGVWEARDQSGAVRDFAWGAWVSQRELRVFDTPLRAKYSAQAQVERWTAALPATWRRSPPRRRLAETHALVLDIDVLRNRRDRSHVRVEAAAGGERP